MDDKRIACIKHREFGFSAHAKILSFWNSVHGSNRHIGNRKLLTLTKKECYAFKNVIICKPQYHFLNILPLETKKINMRQRRFEPICSCACFNHSNEEAEAGESQRV